jgi:hypothetical protein
LLSNGLHPQEHGPMDRQDELAERRTRTVSLWRRIHRGSQPKRTLRNEREARRAEIDKVLSAAVEGMRRQGFEIPPDAEVQAHAYATPTRSPRAATTTVRWSPCARVSCPADVSRTVAVPDIDARQAVAPVRRRLTTRAQNHRQRRAG